MLSTIVINKESLSQSKTQIQNIVANDPNAQLELFTNEIDEEFVSFFNELTEDKEIYHHIDSVKYDCKKDVIEDDNEIEELLEVSKIISQKGIEFDIKLKNAEGDVEQMICSKKKIDEFVEKIAKFEEREGKLSPLEKLAIIYNFVSDRKYVKNYTVEETNWIGALASGNIICSGFASLFEYICTKVFNENEVKCFYQFQGIYEKDLVVRKDFHANNLVYICDQKYGLEGIYSADTCWDHKGDNYPADYVYFLLPFKQMLTYKSRSFKFTNGNPLAAYYGLKKYSPPGIRDDTQEIRPFLEKSYGLKTINEFEKEYLRSHLSGFYRTPTLEQLILEEKKEYEESNKKEFKELKADFLTKAEKLLRNRGISEKIKDIKFITSYPSSLLKNFPDLQDYVAEINKESLENIDEDMLSLYADFYTTHKAELKGVQAESLEEIIAQNEMSEYAFDEIGRIDYHLSQIQKLHDKQWQEFLKNNSNLYDPKPLEDKAVREAIETVCEFQDKSYWEKRNYIDRAMSVRKYFETKEFETRIPQMLEQREKLLVQISKQKARISAFEKNSSISSEKLELENDKLVTLQNKLKKNEYKFEKLTEGNAYFDEM